MKSPGTLGVLLAGGRGRRLGLAVPKALATLGGRTFLELALEALGGACDEVVVALPAGLDLPLAGVARVDDLEPDAGPLAGMIAAFDTRVFDRAIVLGVDYPLMRAGVLRELVRAFDEQPGLDAVIPVADDRAQPLAAVYAPSAVPILRAHFEQGGRSVMEGVDRLRTARLVMTGDAFTHVNTPDDLARAESRR